MATDQGGTEWDGYSDYQAVSRSVAKSIDDAIDAYAWIQSLHRENVTVSSAPAADASADIKAAALRLYVEMQQEHDAGNDEYDEILARWGFDVNDDDGEDEHTIGTEAATDGLISALHEVELQSSMPGWMLDLVTDIRTAGWKLGYLQAGRRSEKRPEDPVEGDAREMFSE